MTLFDESKPIHDGPASHLESTYSFLSRSARPAAAVMRSLLEDWFRHFPDDHKQELAKRFRSDFNVGFHELWLHELLTRFNCALEIHPETTRQRATRIDFKATDLTSSQAYFEAAVVTDQSEEERAYDRLLAVFYDHVNKMHLPDYFLRIAEIRNPNRCQPSATRFKKFVSTCIDSLNYDEVLRLSELGAFDELPHWQYKQGDLEIDFGVIPVSRENRGRLDHQVIGMYPGGFRWGTSTNAVRHKIAKKATKYGKLDAPYLIAINCLSKWGFRQIDEIQALYGSEEFVVNLPSHTMEPRRQPDGIWYGPKGPKNRSVSGVLLTDVGPWHLPKARTCLYLNPWASHPYTGPLTGLPRALLVDSELQFVPGLSQAKVFSLPEGWPGQLFE